MTNVFAELDEKRRMDKVDDAIEYLNFLDKVCLIKSQGFGLDDALFYGWFTQEEDDVLRVLELLGLADTKVVRLLD